MKTDLIEELFLDFKVDEASEQNTVQRAGVTIWLPEDYKAKFNSLQERTKRRFGKKVQQLVIKAIDKVSGL